MAFILALSISIGLCACGNKDDQEDSSNGNLSDAVISTKDNQEQQDTTTTTVADTTVEDTQEATTTEPPHVSPKETVSYTITGQLAELSNKLNYNDDGSKNAKFSLSDLTVEGAKVQSFTFVFNSTDGSDIGTYKGGCGVSVTEDCPSATDDGWYQSEDFEVTAQGSYVEVVWNVPSDVQDYIDTNGDVQIGYWWGDTESVTLSEVMCTYSNTAEISCDETKSVTPKENTLTFGDDDTNKLQLDLSEAMSKGNIPQYISVQVSNADKTSSASMGKVVMGMGISCGDEYYESPNMVQLQTGGITEVSWLLDDDTKKKIKSNGKLTIGYWWGETPSITVDNVTIKSAVGGSSTGASSEEDVTMTVRDTENTSKLTGDIKSITSAQIVEDMKVGWNLGNTLDSYDKDEIIGDAETYFGNPKTTKEMITKVKEAGFNAIRVPVSWTNHISDDNTIDAEWLARVKEVIDYAIDQDLYVIVNVHHDDYTWLNPTYADQDRVTTRLTAIWEQLSDEFKDYDYHLLFEGMNEPRIIGGQDEWTCGTEEERDVINQLLQKFVDTVRASGGNNQYRTLIVTTHAASTDETAVKSLVVPKDDRVIVSVHWYFPYDFAGNESDVNTWGTDEDKSNLDNGFKLLNDTFISKGIPVIIGEFGAVRKDNDPTRALYYEYYVQTAKKYGITCFVWDNNDDFGLFDRGDLTWYSNSVVNSLMDGVNP